MCYNKNRSGRVCMKKLFFILLGIFLVLMSSMLFLKKIYIIDNSGNIDIEVNSDENILKEKLKVEAKYCSILFKLDCKSIDDIQIEENIDYKKLGEYIIKVSVNYKGNKKVLEKKINVVDTTAPIINLKETPLLCPNKFVEPGYEITDNYDTNLNDKVVINKLNNVVYYEVIDSSGNKATAERNLKFGDKEAPKIKLKGYETEYVLVGEKYIEPGYEVTDNCDTNLTKNVQIESNLDTTKAGTYNIKYTVSDSSGNKTSQTRIIKVYDKQQNITIIPSNKVIYLTFDDGPGPYTEKLLNILKKYNVKVTFFVTNQFSSYKNLIKKMHDEGHSIGIHTYSHSYKNIYSSVDAFFSDVDKMDKVIYNLTGTNSKLLRFAGGSSNTISSFNKGIMTILSKETQIRGYKYFDWNVDSMDTSCSNSDTIANNIIKGVKSHNYSIVLQHDIKKASVEAVEKVIKYGLANGYTFLPLDITSPTAHHGINN